MSTKGLLWGTFRKSKISCIGTKELSFPSLPATHAAFPRPESGGGTERAWCPVMPPCCFPRRPLALADTSVESLHHSFSGLHLQTTPLGGLNCSVRLEGLGWRLRVCISRPPMGLAAGVAPRLDYTESKTCQKPLWHSSLEGSPLLTASVASL